MITVWVKIHINSHIDQAYFLRSILKLEVWNKSLKMFLSIKCPSESLQSQLQFLLVKIVKSYNLFPSKVCLILIIIALINYLLVNTTELQYFVRWNVINHHSERESWVWGRCAYNPCSKIRLLCTYMMLWAALIVIHWQF